MCYLITLHAWLTYFLSQKNCTTVLTSLQWLPNEQWNLLKDVIIVCLCVWFVPVVCLRVTQCTFLISWGVSVSPNNQEHALNLSSFETLKIYQSDYLMEQKISNECILPNHIIDSLQSPHTRTVGCTRKDKK